MQRKSSSYGKGFRVIPIYLVLEYWIISSKRLVVPYASFIRKKCLNILRPEENQSAEEILLFAVKH